MTSRDFAFWMQGLFELSEPKSLNENQTELIRNHLALVFKHEIDPSMGPPAHQVVLNQVHQTGMPTPPAIPSFTTTPFGPPNGPVLSPSGEPLMRC